jgi:hypothetical protein
MTPYFESLPPTAKKRLQPYMDTIAKAAKAQGLPPDLYISMIVAESGGKWDAVGDRHLKRPAKGGFQVRFEEELLGGADPMDPVASINAVGPALKRAYEGAGRSIAGAHFKWNAGLGQAYTPENVARVAAKFPHVNERLATMRAAFPEDQQVITTYAPDPGVRPVMQNDPRLAAPLQNEVSPAAQALALTPEYAPAVDWTGYRPEPRDTTPTYLEEVSALLGGQDPLPLAAPLSSAAQGRRVKSKKPSDSLFGLP